MGTGAEITRYQWLVLFVAWLGWVFDSMDSTIYALVLQPALTELLRTGASASVSQEAIGWYGGIIFSIFLVGWAIGGVAFGVLADRVGRTRVLVWTILIYAIFTGLAALSRTWWELAENGQRAPLWWPKSGLNPNGPKRRACFNQRGLPDSCSRQ